MNNRDYVQFSVENSNVNLYYHFVPSYSLNRYRFACIDYYDGVKCIAENAFESKAIETKIWAILAFISFVHGIYVSVLRLKMLF